MSIFISALSVNAESMASVTFDVVRNMTLGYLYTRYQYKLQYILNKQLKNNDQRINSVNIYFLKLSSCVRTAFTTLIESDGSVPDSAESRARVKLSTSSININTNESPYSKTSFICWNIDITNDPLYININLIEKCVLIIINLNTYFREIFG